MLSESVLRIPCAIDEVTDNGVHKHLCECGTSWKHDGELLQEECTTKQFKLAHCCPSCGTEVRHKHYAEGDCRTEDRSTVNLLYCLLFGHPPTDADLKAILD